MNILEYTEKFQDMEMENGLFDRKTFDGIYFWDIVRYDVFELIFRNYLNRHPGQDSMPVQIKKRVFSLSQIVHSLKAVFFDYKYLYANKGKKYVLFQCSRNLINGKKRDIISDDYLKIIGAECFLIETFTDSINEKYFLNELLRYKKKFNTLFHKPIEKFYIDEIINNTFCLDVHLDKFIQYRLENFRVEKKHYELLLKTLKPQAVFFVQNGIQKGMIYACKKLKITSVEFQHGIINYSHPVYSYPTGIERYSQSKFIVPDFLFTLSDYWIKKVNYPVKKSIAMGNTNYSVFISLNTESKNEITFISADIYQNKIERYLDYLLKKNYNCEINIKLHPNQKDQKDKICEKYNKYKTVNVYCNEVTIKELFNRSAEIIVVTSTAAYEAIQNGCRVKIIKDDASYDINDLFRHPNVIVLSEPVDILKKFENEPISTVFFEDFNENKIKNFIAHIAKKDKKNDN